MPWCMTIVTGVLYRCYYVKINDVYTSTWLRCLLKNLRGIRDVSNWSLYLMLFRCWCQNDTALKMSRCRWNAVRGRERFARARLGGRIRRGWGVRGVHAPTHRPPHLTARLPPVSSCGSCWLNHLIGPSSFSCRRWVLVTLKKYFTN